MKFHLQYILLSKTPCAAFIIIQSRDKIQKIKDAHEIKHYNQDMDPE